MHFLNLYRIFIRPILFRFDAERAHHFVLATAKLIFRIPGGKRITQTLCARKVRPMPVQIAGVEFTNPIGLAAGFDKNGVLAAGIESLGFGFVEIGTVTPRPQIGNPQPRLMRVTDKRAIVNRMGFNNDGAEVVAMNIKRVRSQIRIPLGINIGKNRDTPNDAAVGDYERLLKTFQNLASYFVINVSSPNTPGLRDLQSVEFISTLGERVRHLRVRAPVFVKLAPELPLEDLNAICKLCGPQHPFAGLVLTNTISTDLGGMSGRPLKSASIEALKAARTVLDKNVPIISVGGIETADDVEERLKLGASAVQIYSALIYQGPGLVGQILRTMQKRRK